MILLQQLAGWLLVWGGLSVDLRLLHLFLRRPFTSSSMLAHCGSPELDSSQISRCRHVLQCQRR